MNILIFGAGAIGTYIGGSLILRGDRITFIEQPQAVEEITRRGLYLDLSAAQRKPAPVDTQPSITDLHPNIVLPPSYFYCVRSLEEALKLGPYDLAIFALKSFDTQPVIESLQSFLSDLPPFLCLQNGVENEVALANALGPDRVIAGTVTSAVSRRNIGEIILERLRGIGVALGHPISRRLVYILNEAGLNAQVYTSSAEMKWSKLLTNLLANATSAILDMTPAEVFAHPGLYRLEIDQLVEALRVMDAQNLRVVNLPGTPVRLLALGTRLPIFLSKPLMQRSVGKGRGAKMPSFHIDLHSGRGKSEVDFLNGAVARFGKRLGVPTPVNLTLNETLLALTEGKTPLEFYARKPQVLLDSMGERE